MRRWSYTALREEAEVIADRARNFVAGVEPLELGIDRLKQITIGALDLAQGLERLTYPTRWERIEDDSMDLQGCTPMPNRPQTAQELELLALAAQERQRNGTPQPHRTASPGHTLQLMLESSPPPASPPTVHVRTASVELPELTPDMLLSASAWREVEAARAMAGPQHFRMPAAQQQQPRVLAPRPAPRVSRDEIEMGEDMGDLDLDALDAPPPQVTTDDASVLNSLFMGREAQEAQAVLGSGSFEGGSYGIEFDADSMLEGRTAPNESVRFQIGRQTPPRIPFSARMEGGPSDGVVVSSRGQSGWQQQQQMRAPEPRQVVASRPRPAPSRPVPPPAQIPRVSRFEHISRGGIVDDD